MNAPLIEAKGLAKTYQDDGVATTALRSVDFIIREGEFVSIMGPSGSGKSTLLHLLGLLDRPSSGTYLLGGINTSDLSDEELARLRNERIGFVFQSFYLLSRSTVLENVILPLHYSRVPRSEYQARALEALEHVEMTHRLHHTSAQLSGGEKQRVAIARALVTRAKLILADEPTGNLDTKTGQAVLETIDALHKRGYTIVVITHESPTARYAQRILTIQDGGIVQDEAVTSRHGHYQK